MRNNPFQNMPKYGGRPKTLEPSRPQTFNILDRQFKWIDERAKELKVSKSVLVRDILDAASGYLASLPPPPLPPPRRDLRRKKPK